MGTKQGAYVQIAADALAEWLSQDADLYWTVDGDPKLSGMLSFPCPGDELAEALRKIDKPLLVLDREGKFHGKPISSSDLDGLVEEEELDARVLYLRWKDSEIEWILVEDVETSESVSRESRSGSSSSSSSLHAPPNNMSGDAAPDGGSR